MLLVLMIVNQAAAFATAMRETRSWPENDDRAALQRADKLINGQDEKQMQDMQSNLKETGFTTLDNIMFFDDLKPYDETDYETDDEEDYDPRPTEAESK